MVENKDKALRYDSDKPRHDLIPAFGLNELAKVFAMGAKKYADWNWAKGMKWSRVSGSLKRHLNAYERGEDFDAESGLHHMTHVMWNALTILEYYKIYPEGDDRPHTYLQNKKIGLDIDEVICDWMNAWRDLYGIEDTITSWYFDRDIQAKFSKMRDNNTLDDFYMSLKPLLNPEDIPFEPHAYITSRPVDIEVTQKWLDMHGFPHRPIYSVGSGKSKVDAAKEAGIDIFVDDNYNNFVELNKAGICTFLYDKPHNARYPVGYKRIKSLKELI